LRTSDIHTDVTDAQPAEGQAQRNDSRNTPVKYPSSITKRSMDIFISLFGLTFLALVLPFIWLALALTSRGPILFKQIRLGKDGREFTVLKFRSMRVPKNGESWESRTVENDSRVVFVGRILRKSYLDELPQFWNVLRGQMSIVGPRPEVPDLARIITERHPRFERRLAVKPGITGPAQIYYIHPSNGEDAWKRY
jgi:lipopolysaccharide/colanic/teichoic acid biosynthesis glycosyltransferase